MLKPKRKITRKEIKKDPLLETIDLIEAKFEKNKKTYGNVVMLVFLVLIGGYIFTNKQNQNKIESNSALGVAMVAYSKMDYENAKFQFESIKSNFGNTSSSNTSSYFLGKIAYQNNDFINSSLHLNDFLKYSDDDILVCGAIKLLTEISLKNNNYEEALRNLDKAKNYKFSNSLMLDLELMKASTFLNMDDSKNGKAILEEIDNQIDLPSHIKQRLEELYGMI
tara:strand:+ start:64 stop:732 length:669 start_codon:yes stop_codon:yes gene_type:complete